MESKELSASLKSYLKRKYHLTTNEFFVFKELFKSIDKDKNNRISQLELKKLLNQLGKYPEHEELAAFFDKLDKNKSGEIDFQEMIKLLVEEELHLSEDPFLLDAFSFFDSNADGLITRVEFKRAMAILGEKWRPTQIDNLIDLADSDEDGCINFRGKERVLF